MSITNLPSLDFRLKLLSGSSFYVGNVEIKPYLMQEIIDYGYTEYMQNVQLLTISKEEFIGSVREIEKRVLLETERDKIKTFDFFVKLGGEELRQVLISALSMVLRTDDVRIIDDQNIVVIDFVKLGIIREYEDGSYDIDAERLDSLSDSELKVINRDNFDELAHVIKLQNYLATPEENKAGYNPADQKAKELAERMEKYRAKVEKKKKMEQAQDEGEMDFYDILDAVSVKSNSINKTNIWSLTIYQVYCEYARLEIIDNYDYSIKAVMAGAKIDIKHWSSKLK